MSILKLKKKNIVSYTNEIEQALSIDKDSLPDQTSVRPICAFPCKI